MSTLHVAQVVSIEWRPLCKAPGHVQNTPMGTSKLEGLACMQGLDLSQGMAAAVPEWEDVRLLAPHAELRLLACGQASLIQPHRLRSGSGSRYQQLQ